MLEVDQFVGDHGEPVEHFPEISENGYANLYINGIMQEGGLFRTESDAIYLMPTGQTILAGSPIVLETVRFVVHNKS